MYTLNQYTGTAGNAGQFPAYNRFLVKAFLDNLKQSMNLDLFAKKKRIPNRSSKTIQFVRFTKMSAATTKLTEGVTPDAEQLTLSKITFSLEQYGSFVYITDQMIDHGEDATRADIAVEQSYQATLTQESLIRDCLTQGTSVVYANGSARAQVNNPISIAAIRRAIRYFRQNSVMSITKMLKGSEKQGTAIVKPSYIGYVAPDVVADLSELPGWKSVESYGSYSGVLPNEQGAVEGVRFLENPLLQPSSTGLADSGGSATGLNVVSTSGSSADVYLTPLMGSEAFCVTTNDRTSVEVITRGFGEGEDPLKQRATQGWKMMFVAGRLNEQKLCRVESAASDISVSSSLA